jgi:hypothetical protein
MPEVVHITDDQINDVSRTMLIRQWWYLYAHLLRERSKKWQDELTAVTDECERRGIVKLGQPMPKDGADAPLLAAAHNLLELAGVFHTKINGLHATMRATSREYAASELCRVMNAYVRDNASAIAEAEVQL